MMERLLSITLILLWFSLHANGQEPNQILDKYTSYKQNNPIEYTYLNTDKKIYFSGGQVKFSVAILDQYLLPSQASGIVYLELLHEQDEFKKKYVFRIKDGILNDRIVLPMDIPTGNFQLVAYTHFMRNFRLDKVAQRASIYIQNSLEPTKPVIKNVIAKSIAAQSSEEIQINIGETRSKLLFEINSPYDIPIDAFFVSEGFGTIQFAGKIKMKRGKTDISIKKELLKGNFQKIILLDKNLKVLTGRAYYLTRSGTSTSSKTKLSNESGPFLGKVESVDKLNADSLHLFKRLYKLYYQIPQEVDIDHLSYDELTETSTLVNYSGYVKQEWSGIMQNELSEKSLAHAPERNIHLKGTVSGDLKKLNSAHLAVHFFNADLDMIAPVKPSGSFDVEIPWGMGDNAFIASIVNEKEGDISDEYSFTAESFQLLSYTADQYDYFLPELIDSLVTKKKEFNYVLSTFNEDEESNSFLEEIEEVERKFLTVDFRNITSFEEFIREAVMDVSVVQKNGEKSLNIYNSIKGKFNTPQMIILNDMVLEESRPLFDIPIEILVSVNVIIDREALSDLGSTFTGGILRVETSKPVVIPSEYLDDKFGTISGFYYAPKENTLSDEFNPSNPLELVSGNDVNPLIEKIEGSGKDKPFIEFIQNDGTYHYLFNLND